MSNPFLGEIRIVPFNFAPTGWATCDGQLMPINQNAALFSLLGTFFGGDGISTFGLPNLDGRAPMGLGASPGLTTRNLGDTGGEQAVELNISEMPGHSHVAMGNTATGVANSPAGADWGVPHLGKTGINAYTSDTGHNTPMSPSALQSVGGNQPHNNMSPFLTMTFIIALSGVFPSRS